MAQTAVCPNCGERVGLKPGQAPASAECPWCGVACAAPRQAAKPQPAPSRPPVAAPPPRKPAATTRAVPAAVTPAAKAKPAAPKPPADGSDDADYYLPGEGSTKPCPNCNVALPLDVKACVKCGYDLIAKRKVERTYQPLARRFEAGWSLPKRRAVYAGLLVCNVVAFGLAWSSKGVEPVSMLAMLMLAGAQAFLVGTFDRTDLSRDARGKSRVVRTWRVAFYQLPPSEVLWREHEGVVVQKTHSTDIVDYWLLIILIGHGVIPGLLFWWYSIRPERYVVALTKNLTFPETVLYRGTDERHAKDLAAALRHVTGLPDPYAAPKEVMREPKLDRPV